MSVRLPVKYIAGLSAVGLITIASWEAYREDAYIPVPGDVPTYGFGTTTHDDGSPVQLGEKISVPAALARTGRDVRKFEDQAVQACVTVPLYQYEYDAYVSFAYNVGSGNFCRSTLVKKLNAGDYAGACAELDQWVYAGGRRLQGLVNRRAAERALCEGRG